MSTEKHNEETELVRFRGTKTFVKRLDRVARNKGLKRPEVVKIALVEFFEREDAK